MDTGVQGKLERLRGSGSSGQTVGRPAGWAGGPPAMSAAPEARGGRVQADKHTGCCGGGKASRQLGPEWRLPLEPHRAPHCWGSLHCPHLSGSLLPGGLHAVPGIEGQLVRRKQPQPLALLEPLSPIRANCRLPGPPPLPGPPWACAQGRDREQGDEVAQPVSRGLLGHSQDSGLSPKAARGP